MNELVCKYRVGLQAIGWLLNPMINVFHPCLSIGQELLCGYTSKFHKHLDSPVFFFFGPGLHAFWFQPIISPCCHAGSSHDRSRGPAWSDGAAFILFSFYLRSHHFLSKCQPVAV